MNKNRCEYMRAYRRKYREIHGEELRRKDCEYAAAHREEARQRASKWYRDHPKKARASRKSWYERNKEQMAEYSRDYRQKNLEKLRAYDRKRSKTEERCKLSRECRRKSADINRLRVKEWVKANPEKAKVTRRLVNERRRARLAAVIHEDIDRRHVYWLNQGICGICGIEVSKGEFEIDHIIPISHGGAHTYANVQVAHKTCNRRKGNNLQDIVYT